MVSYVAVVLAVNEGFLSLATLLSDTLSLKAGHRAAGAGRRWEGEKEETFAALRRISYEQGLRGSRDSP